MRKGQQLKQQNNSEQSSVKLGTPGVLLVCSGTLLVTLLRQEYLLKLSKHSFKYLQHKAQIFTII